MYSNSNRLTRLPIFAAVVTALLVSAACAPVRLIEENDPRIEAGMTEYQSALQVFVQATLANYEACRVGSEALARAERMSCDEGSAEVRHLCEEIVRADEAELAAQVDASCTAASFAANQRSFYIEQEARLRVLKTRASVLDAMGICVSAINGVGKAVSGLVPSEIRAAINVASTEQANNCTEILVDTVVQNHVELGTTHSCIDIPNQETCPEDFKDIDVSDWNNAEQALGFLPIMLDTLNQNVRVVLFLEEAKKRGGSSEEG